MFTALIFIVLAYFLGSVSSAILICQLFRLPDPREHGSGNPGATNVLRTGNKLAAALVFVGDFLKGLLAVLLARLFHVENFLLSLVAAAAVAGHIFPIFFQFKGGKGVATSFGAILMLYPPLAITIIILWLACVILTRYVSLASLVGAVGAIICCLALQPFPYELGVMLIAALVLFRHKDNFLRLLDGSESKISFRKSSN